MVWIGGKKMANNDSGVGLTSRVQCRLTPRELREVREGARTAGMTLSNYVRRRILGHRVIASADQALIRELRRLGGLAKHLHVQSGGVYKHETAAVLVAVRRSIEKLARE